MIAPIVRYMIVCRDWKTVGGDATQIDISGLVTTIKPASAEEFPLLVDEICVVLVLSSLRGKGWGQILIVDDETDLPLFGSRAHLIEAPNSPLAVRGVSFRMANCPIRRPVVCRVQFRYNDEVIEEKYLRVKEAVP